MDAASIRAAASNAATQQDTRSTSMLNPPSGRAGNRTLQYRACRTVLAGSIAGEPRCPVNIYRQNQGTIVPEISQDFGKFFRYKTSGASVPSYGYRQNQGTIAPEI